MPGIYFAYTFRSPFSLAQMKEKLEEAGPWRWAEGDSEYWGDYLQTRPFARLSKFKIFEDEGQYVLDIAYDYDDDGAEASWETHHAILTDEILPAIEARNVKKAEGYT